MSQLWFIPLAFALPVLVTVIRARRAKRWAAQLRRGETVRIPLRLSGEAPPYPRRARSGHLVLDGDRLGFEARRGGVIALGSRRLQVVGSEEQDQGIAVRCRDGAGVVVRLQLGEEYLEPVREVLEKGRADLVDPSSRLRSSRVPIAAVVLAALAVLLGGGFELAYRTGVEVTATVLTNDAEETCQVEWASPWGGAREHAAIDCDADTAGTVRVVAANHPFRGEAIDTYDSEVVALIASGVLLVLAALVVAWRAWRGRKQPEVTVAPVEGALEPVVDLLVTNTSQPAVVEAIRLRADPDRPLAPANEDNGLRGFWIGALVRSVGPLLFLAIGTGLAVGPALAALALSSGPTKVTTADVSYWSTDREFPFLPYDVDLAFSAGDRHVEVTTQSLTKGGDDAPDQVEIRYAVSDPSKVELVDRSGQHRSYLLPGALALVALLFLVRGVVVTWRDTRSLRRVAAQSASGRFEYAVVDGPPSGIVLFSDQTPRWLMELHEDTAAGLPLTGEIDVYGALVEDGVVVLGRGAERIFPTSTLTKATADRVCELVNGFPIEDTA